MPSKPDRPRAITPETQAKIVALLRGGNYLETACAAAGIDKGTYYYWKKLLESGTRHAQKYADFFNACRAASAEAESESLITVRTGEQGWQGPAWFLSRRFPKRWGKRREEPDARSGSEQPPLADGDEAALDEVYGPKAAETGAGVPGGGLPA